MSSGHHHEEEALPLLDTYTPPASDLDRLGRFGLIAGAAGAVATAALGFANPSQFLKSYLVAYVWVFGTALGCFAVMTLHHLSSGAWGLMIRRILEAASRTIPLLALAFVPIGLGLKTLYSWAGPEAHGHGFRAAYLTPSGFIVRALVCFALWSGVALLFSALSLRQDKTGDPQIRKRMQRIASAAACVHVLCMTSCAIDWLMSLSPHWSSTIYGFYVIVGQVVAALAFIIVMSVFLAGRAPLEGRFRAEHFHDYGKLLLAFIMIWAYFSVSQFIIIWSGNLPEETSWYMGRMNGGWRWFSVLLVFSHFVLPFVLLLSRNLKRDRKRLARVAGMMLVVRWLDLYWLAAPAFSDRTTIHPLDVTTAVGLFGLWFFVFTRQLKTRSLLPVNEPALKEALGHG
ncbi:MAG TPA: hypothetical protein VJT73_21610 [Polyangiaceae bacterium]|nr:hypothetical protein [Polyangiaceae bacterium]